jgi:hypothetical protein
MKLYATVTSEAGKEAKKGGNSFLDVRIIDEQRLPVATLCLTAQTVEKATDKRKAVLTYWDNSMDGDGFTSEVEI